MAYIGIQNEFVQKRIAKVKGIRDGIILKGVENYHTKVMTGNIKTGKSVWTVSLAPILDCKHCGLCKNTCYDVAHDLRHTRVIESRAINSAIHKEDPTRYWDEISANIIANGISQLRLNVGGDLIMNDFYELNRIAKKHTRTSFLFFTKNIEEINKFLDTEKFEPNVKVILSRWENDKFDNKHNLPESHVLFTKHTHDAVDSMIKSNGDIHLLGKTTATNERKNELCGGNCSACYLENKGCWNAQNGTNIILIAH